MQTEQTDLDPPKEPIRDKTNLSKPVRSAIKGTFVHSNHNLSSALCLSRLDAYAYNMRVCYTGAVYDVSRKHEMNVTG
jgi:hypothetical protein